ncbi:MAG: hypothetical protein R2939_12240 [Kofleriaceae bacterium]
MVDDATRRPPPTSALGRLRADRALDRAVAGALLAAGLGLALVAFVVGRLAGPMVAHASRVEAGSALLGVIAVATVALVALLGIIGYRLVRPLGALVPSVAGLPASMLVAVVVGAAGVVDVVIAGGDARLLGLGALGAAALVGLVRQLGRHAVTSPSAAATTPYQRGLATGVGAGVAGGALMTLVDVVLTSRHAGGFGFAPALAALWLPLGVGVGLGLGVWLGAAIATWGDRPLRRGLRALRADRALDVGVAGALLAAVAVAGVLIVVVFKIAPKIVLGAVTPAAGGRALGLTVAFAVPVLALFAFAVAPLAAASPGWCPPSVGCRARRCCSASARPAGSASPRWCCSPSSTGGR